MIEDKNIFVCIVLHHSDLRPEGYQMAVEFRDSWKKYNFPYSLVILDNQSSCEYQDVFKGIDHHFIRVDDQVKAGGITGAWNHICKYAIDMGAEIITGFNDDVKLNETFPVFIDAIKDDNTIYGPLTDGIRSGPWQEQKSQTTRPGWVGQINTLNGFWIGFTRRFYLDKVEEGKLFIKGKYRFANLNDWSGQEAMFDHWRQKYKTVCKIIGDCWIEHTKLRAWTNAKAKYL